MIMIIFMIKIMIHLFSNNDHAEPPITFMDIIITAKIILELGAIIPIDFNANSKIAIINKKTQKYNLNFISKKSLTL